MKIDYFDSLRDFKKIRSIWIELISYGSPHSFFQSWEWVECWLLSLNQENEGIDLVVVFDLNCPQVAFFIGKNKSCRNFFVKSSSLSINTSNNPYYDDICIEYNTLLINPEFRFSYKDIFLSLDHSHQWDEIYLPAIETHTRKSITSSLDNNNLKILFEKTSPTYYVDLKFIRESGRDYIDQLSTNKRRQIKSSVNAYSKLGAISIKQAETEEESIAFFDEMVELHQERWVKIGEPGAFSNLFLLNFHKRLIQSNLKSGRIQLLKVMFGSMTIGYLYNFIYNKRVYFYQSGFNFRSGNKYRPGIVSHYYAILFNIEKGYEKYDFLVGNDAYKKSLSTHSAELHWITIQKKLFRFQVELALKRILRFIRRAR